MRIWKNSYTHDNPWDTVVRAFWRKYPNEFNPAVVGLDVVDRKINKDTGILSSHRLMQTKWGLPDWSTAILGMGSMCYVSEHSAISTEGSHKVFKIMSRNILGRASVCYGSEHSEVNPKAKTLTLKTRNLTFYDVISIEETIVYRPDNTDRQKTVVEQENVVTVHGVPLGSYLEKMVTDRIEVNADKGRAAMENVIAIINQEKAEVLRNIENVLHSTPLKNAL